MGSLTWSVVHQQQQSDFYWKWDETPTTIELGTSAYPLLIIPKVTIPRMVSFSITNSTPDVFQIINLYLWQASATAEHLGTLTATPDFQCRVGHQQLNWEMSSGLFAKKTDGNENGIKITYRCAIKEYL